MSGGCGFADQCFVDLAVFLGCGGLGSSSK